MVLTRPLMVDGVSQAGNGHFARPAESRSRGNAKSSTRNCKRAITGRGQILRLVSEVGCEPTLDFGKRHLLAAGIVFRLFARHAIEREVAGLRMGEI